MQLLTVGGRGVSVAEAQRVLDRVPIERLRQLAPAPGGVKGAFVEEFLAKQLRREQHAARLGQQPDAAHTARAARDAALQQALERQLAKLAVVKDEMVAAFYEEHMRRYRRPPAIRIWRLLLPDESAARDAIARVKDRADGVSVWSQLTRESSLDKATNMRDGDLGFVHADGHTDVPQVRVDASLVAAAAQVADGELVPNPVPEGDYFAVVWRRGTRPERIRSLEQEQDAIRQVLARDHARAAQQKLLNELREAHLSAFSPELVESIDYPKVEGIPVPQLRRTQHAAAGKPNPDPNRER